MSKHTPGPWKWTGPLESMGTTSMLLDAEGSTVVYHDACWIPNPADRALIAAAPDMLAALKWIASEYPDMGCGMRALDEIRKAEDQ